MVYRRRSTRPRRRVNRKRMNRRKRVMRPKAQNVARVSDTSILTATRLGGGSTNSFATSALNVSGPVYFTDPISLISSLRAQGVAGAYQYYRIRYCEIKFTPQADTFSAGGAIGVPYLYYVMDKGGSIPENITTTALKTLGCKPIRLDDKSITIRFKPSVLLDTNYVSSSGAQASNMYKISPWLNTNAQISGTFAPSTVAHRGIVFFAENAGTGLNFNATLTVHVDFKAPLYPSPV